MDDTELVPGGETALAQVSDVPQLLDLIRPSWQAKDLIARVRRLLFVDPSSACQRIFNAAIHDLREKVVLAGVDIAREAAAQYKLPPIAQAEDVEEYSTARLLDLAYRMGILSRAEWRRLCRVYEIRRDLEHEDDQYEAGIEDCIYVFKTCIEVVLARDPIYLLRVADVKDIVENPGPVVPDQSLLQDFERAPEPRQEQISLFLMSVIFDEQQPDVVRQNAFSVLGRLEPLTQNSVKLNLAKHLQEGLGRTPLDHAHARVAYVSGTFPYLRRSQRATYFDGFLRELKKVGHGWPGYPQHGELLRRLQEVGGLRFVPPTQRRMTLEWLVLAYVGEPGGYGTYGRNRPVFFSNTAAPLVSEIVADAAGLIKDDLNACASAASVQKAVQNQYVARRFQELLDIVETGTAIT